MRLVVDMSLSPLWVDALAAHGIESAHWSTVGDGRAPDESFVSTARHWTRVRSYRWMRREAGCGSCR